MVIDLVLVTGLIFINQLGQSTGFRVGDLSHFVTPKSKVVGDISN